MRVQDIVMIYFVIGAIMFGGGAISYGQTGVTAHFVQHDNSTGSYGTNQSAHSKLTGLGGEITSLVGQFNGGILIVWNLIVSVVKFLGWPLAVMLDNNVPFRIALVTGGTLTVAFYMGLVSLVARS